MPLFINTRNIYIQYIRRDFQLITILKFHRCSATVGMWRMRDVYPICCQVTDTITESIDFVYVCGCLKCLL